MSIQEVELQGIGRSNSLVFDKMDISNVETSSLLQSKYKHNHLYLLLVKNYLVYTRQFFMTFLMIISPLLICIMIIMWQALVDSLANFLELNPPVKPLIKTIPHCHGFDCISIGYFVLGEEDPWINKTMEIVADSEQLQFGKDVKLLGTYLNPSHINEYLLNNLNKTQIAVVFCTDRWQISSEPQFSIPCQFDRLSPQQLVFYTIMYNYTLLYKTPYLSDMKSSYPKDSYATKLKVSLDNAILQVFNKNKNTPKMDIYTQDFPLIPNRFVEGIDIGGNYGAFYFFMPYLFGFLLTVNELLVEKGRRLRQGLVVMGLSHSTYWLSWILTALIKTFLLTLVLEISGLLFRFDLFVKTPILIIFTLFMTFGFGVQLLAFFICVICPDVKNGYTIAYGFILIALIMQMFFTQYALTILFVKYIIFKYKKYRSDSSNWVQVVRFILSIYPAFKYSMIYGDISTKSCKHYSIDENRWVEGDGYTYGDLFQSQTGAFQISQLISYSSPSAIVNYFHLCLSCLFFGVLIYYFDHVLASNRGRSESVFFCIQQPVQYIIGCFKKRCRNNQISVSLNQDLSAPPSQYEEQKNEIEQQQQNNTAEEEKSRVIHNQSQGNEVNGLRIVGLSKVYNKYPFGIQSIDDVNALKEIYLEIESGELLALLGHNGAGKTTLIGVLTGMMDPTTGTAQILNYDIKESIQEIRKIIGLCPQFDILWDQLTAGEHLQMYAAIKKVPKESIDIEVDLRLREVDLYHVKNALVGTFSGGMKRRMSLAISVVGDPKIVILDEPTTGMDPKARRQVWQVIKNMKSNRVVLLTTHAMEEADALADRIAVMAQGQLKCIGSSLYLKNKFSDGYRLNVVCDPEKRDQTIQLLKKLLKEAKLQDASGGSLILSIALEYMSVLQKFFQIVENDQQNINNDINDFTLGDIKLLKGLIKEWGLSHATLEEVFMRVTKKYE